MPVLRIRDASRQDARKISYVCQTLWAVTYCCCNRNIYISPNYSQGTVVIGKSSRRTLYKARVGPRAFFMEVHNMNYISINLLKCHPKNQEYYNDLPPEKYEEVKRS